MVFVFVNKSSLTKQRTKQVATAKMNLAEEIELEAYVQRPEKLSAAEITAICQEVRARDCCCCC